MKKILKDIDKLSDNDKKADFSSSTLQKLQDRSNGLMRISVKYTSKGTKYGISNKINLQNFNQSFYTAQSVAKSTQQFLVCCGAPGIGKTRYRFELFNHLKNNPKDVLIDLHSQRPVSDPDFVSIYLDFGLEVRLNKYDFKLTANFAIALCIAFKFFVYDQSYEMDFEDFCKNIYCYFKVDSTKSLREFESTVNFHNSSSKEFTMELLCTMAQYMMNNRTFIQTYLSGTALHKVVKLKESTGYSFNYINCPLLLMDACIEILNDFTVKNNDTNYR
ncbi:hypothetical protein RhiirA4_482336 [Rhizophagus irregularis]|uniref:Crinkler family protein n=1 Tax=Rhizophagus irregularis TaxID=588596 RepID=A0A2I1HKW6_9GLOM|nr:hypothetical protein RhiirA4_482336 [Rhizophagus irregularis]